MQRRDAAQGVANHHLFTGQNAGPWRLRRMERSTLCLFVLRAKRSIKTTHTLFVPVSLPRVIPKPGLA